MGAEDRDAGSVHRGDQSVRERWCLHEQRRAGVRGHPYMLPQKSGADRTVGLQMSASTRTPNLRLTVINSCPPATERLLLDLTPHVREFLDLVGRAGLPHELAIRLGLERALLLSDAYDLRLNVERARRILNLAGGELRTSVPLTSEQSAYLRRLYAPPLKGKPLVGGSVTIALPEDVLTLVRNTITESAFHSGAVTEMHVWERAARVRGRTMREWGLKTLALALTNS